MGSAYVIISPCRNEGLYIEKTITTMLYQSIKPMQWVIVNDGSTDDTEQIIDRYLKDNPWIKKVNKVDRGFTQVGQGVIEAFDAGLEALDHPDWEFIVKLDCDVSFGPDYFKNLLDEFSQNERLGVTGGATYVIEKGKEFEERMPEFHPWAGARIYRRECFEDIGGLEQILGWDMKDLVRAQMRGWETIRFKEQKIIHHRRMSSRKSLWEGKTRVGREFYILGYGPFFLVARSIYRATQKPYLVESFGVMYGYFKALINRERLVMNEEEKRHLRRQQRRRLLGLKK